MENLVLPAQVTVRLVGRDESPVKIADVLFKVTAFARRKNNFCFQPFASNQDGLVTITKKDLEAGVADCYDEGVMDYAHINECSPSVEIRLLTEQEVIGAVKARQIWKNLLAGERNRWESMEQLLALYNRASNDRLIVEQSPPLRANWNQDGGEFSYTFVVVLKNPIL